MTDLSKLDAANTAIQKQATMAKTTKAFDQAATDAIHALDTRITKLEATPAPTPTPTPTPTPIGGVLEINPGTYPVSQFNQMVDAAFQKSTNGKLLVRPVPGTKPVVTGNHQQRNGLTVQDMIFDGQLQEAECGITGKIGWRYVGCTFRNYFKGAGANDQHSQAIAIWGGNRDFIIDGCKFYDNGTTSHIWLSYFGYGPQSEWYNPANISRDGCIKGCEFGPTYGAWFGVHYTTEAFDRASGVRFDPSCYLKPSSSLKPGQRNPELFFDQKLVGACA